MSLLLRVLLAAGGSLAALFVARDSPIFGVAQGMLAIAAVVAVLFLLAVTRRR